MITTASKQAREGSKCAALGQVLFGLALLMLIASVAYLLVENVISVRALELQLESVDKPHA